MRTVALTVVDVAFILYNLAKIHGVLQDAATQPPPRATPFKAAHEVAMLHVE